MFDFRPLGKALSACDKGEAISFTASNGKITTFMFIYLFFFPINSRVKLDWLN